MAKAIMLQGTSSHVGKSILTTALCRIFYQDGLRVVPFKAQNMALNSYVTKEGGEMGRAQVAQAEAAGLEPEVEMNPVLLKPTGNACSQVIVMGKPVGTLSAKEYHTGFSVKALGVIKECLNKYHNEYDIICIEGAGSPAEINLKANDIVNMRIAKLTPAPVLLIADIDRGGALASVVGTLELLEQDERDIVKGIIINKFRGDVSLLTPALDFLEKRTGKPVVGVIPHLENLEIDDEDSVSLDEKTAGEIKDIDIAVLRLPKISNFTDFDAFQRENDVSVRYINTGECIGNPDMVIIPGSKNTTEDLMYLRQSGLEAELIHLAEEGTPVVGICGGYQMIGKKIYDPEHTESQYDSIDGIGLLNTETTFVSSKITHQVKVSAQGQSFLGLDYSAQDLHGYEIHMGRTVYLGEVENAFTVTERIPEKVDLPDGAVRTDGLVMGTYIHGIFDNDEYRRAVINALRVRKGLEPLKTAESYAKRKQAAYDRLADVVRQHLDMPLLYKIMGMER